MCVYVAWATITIGTPAPTAARNELRYGSVAVVTLLTTRT